MSKKWETVDMTLQGINGETYSFKETDVLKECRGKDYNYLFNKINGNFARCGNTHEEDPDFSPVGPEIMDIEITTSCRGKCPWCYKSNVENGKNMTLETFQKILNIIPLTVTQIAFGLDKHCDTNPETFQIFQATRSRGIVPNVTVGYATDEIARKLAHVCGAVAVSRYENENECYDTVEKLTRYSKEKEATLKQVNIHHLVSEETYDRVLQTINDIKTDPRLKDLNAIVFLSLKKKGRGKNLTNLDPEKFKKIIDICLDAKINYGFDSCSCHKFLSSIEGHKMEKEFKQMAEPCESTLFSIYINVDGIVTPCSFCEDCESLKEFDEEVIDLKNVKDFITEVWNHKNIVKFREKLLANGRKCPIYTI